MLSRLDFAEVGALRPATPYHHRVRCLGAPSPVGRTRTLPGGSVEQVKLAVVSCSNDPAGFFNAYARIAEHDDLVDAQGVAIGVEFATPSVTSPG